MLTSAAHGAPDPAAQTTISLIVELRENFASNGLDRCAHTIAWHLKHRHDTTVPVNSIYRHLGAGGYIMPGSKINGEARLPG